MINDTAEMEKQMVRMEEARQRYQKSLAFLNENMRSEQGKELLAQMDKLRKQAKPLTDKAVQLGLQNKTEEATKVLLTEVRPAQNKWLDTLQALVEFQAKRTAEHYQAAKDAYSGARTLMLILAALGVVLGVIIAFVITRSITRPVGTAVAAANRIAEGDLATDLGQVTSKDEVGQMLKALQIMQANLRDIVVRIKESTDTINTASKEIAAGNSDLSQRTEEQASSLEETASSMEELTSTVKQNAENAKQANQLAKGASEIAVRGGEVVNDVVQTMAAINESSRKIVDIISVIDGIAFQTNILALNAAVEAARAGEQGRGFAVVAGEVRNLAQRSAAAAKEIKTLIGDSVEKVEGGSKLVEQAGSTMEEVVVSVKRVTDIISEISAASLEQSTGIEQVNQAVTQMDEVTQQNAALVEQAAAAAESLEEQAESLAEAVSVFRLDAASASTGKRHAPRQVTKAPVRKATPAVSQEKKNKPAVPALANASDDEWEEF